MLIIQVKVQNATQIKLIFPENNPRFNLNEGLLQCNN